MTDSPAQLRNFPRHGHPSHRTAIIISATLALTAVVVLCAAQSDSKTPTLPSGLRIAATLNSGLSARKANLGDKITLDVFSAVHGKDGKVLIPAHATLVGKITQVSPFVDPAHPSILAFAAQQAEWKGGSLALDAAVFGVMALPDLKAPLPSAISARQQFELDQYMRGVVAKGEMVEDVRAATLRHEASVEIVDARTVSWSRGFGLAVAAPSKIMDLELSNDPGVRTCFTSDKHDVELPAEFLVVLLSGMKVVP